MKIQLLFFPGCPNALAARELLQQTLAAYGIMSHFEEIDVTAHDTPDELRGWGSPTILVNGIDVAGGKPTGASCRLYGSAPEEVRGVPPEHLVRKAIERARPGRRELFRSLALVPGALLSLLPSFSCPACLPAYASILSAVGVGALLSERVLPPLIVVFLVIGISSMAWSARSHRRLGPLVLTVSGALGVVIGRIIWSIPAVLYAGTVLLIGAAVWNLWLKRQGAQPLIQLP